MICQLEVLQFIERAATVYPERIGLVDEPALGEDSLGSLTFSQILQRVRSQALALEQLGVKPGQRVAIISKNTARFLISLFAVSGYGRVLVPINYRLNEEDIRYIMEHSGADVLLVDPDLDELTKNIPVSHRFVLGRESDKMFFAAGESEMPTPWPADEAAAASINYTSGTTARPKGVVLTHRNLWINSVVFGLHLGLSDRDVYLHTLPLFHCNGWGMPYVVTGMGGRHILLDKIDGEEILKRVEEQGVTIMNGAPTVVAMILDAAARREGPIPGSGSVRIVVAGAPPPSSIIEKVETVLGWEFIQIYGLTETSPLLTVNRGREEWDALTSNERAVKLSRAGVPAIGVNLGIAADGEILARCNGVLDSYWDQPEISAEVLRDDWFHTGDGGVIGEDGYLTINDRKKDMIITGGENVSSIEVEDVLFSHPAVTEVAVIGVYSEKWGEDVKALVVLEPGKSVSEAELIDYCRERLSHFKCPKTVEFRDSLERTATGKLQKFKLRAPYWKEAPGVK